MINWQQWSDRWGNWSVWRENFDATNDRAEEYGVATRPEAEATPDRAREQQARISFWGGFSNQPAGRFKKDLVRGVGH